jgi:hypothetical protein
MRPGIPSAACNGNSMTFSIHVFILLMVTMKEADEEHLVCDVIFLWVKEVSSAEIHHWLSAVCKDSALIMTQSAWILCTYQGRLKVLSC